MPDDTGMVIVAAPDTNPLLPRAYDLLRYYNPVTGTHGLRWYPWPPVRSIPRPAQESDYPSGRVTPISSDSCTAYAERSLGPKVCPEYEQPGPRERVHGQEQPDRAQQDELLQCYNYVRYKFGRLPPASPPPYDAFKAYREEIGVGSKGDGAFANLTNTTIMPTWNSSQGNMSQELPHNESAQDDDHRRRRLRAATEFHGSLDKREDSGLPASSLLSEAASGEMQTDYTGLSAPHPELAALIRQEMMDRLRRQLQHMEERQAQVSDQGVAAAAAEEEEELAADTEASRRGTRERRRLQMATAEERAVLMAKEHWELTVEEKISMLPNWQRRLLLPNELGTEEAFNIVQQRIREQYTDSACNATTGCNLIYGRCLNTSHGDVYGYDQNGTCTCHSWFTGGDCSTPITEGDRCIYYDEMQGREVRLEVATCRALREKLYLCGQVGESDGLPRHCVEKGLTALECLEAGFMRDAQAAYGINRTSAFQAGNAAKATIASIQNGGHPLTGDAASRRSSEWLLDAAEAAHRRACEIFAVEGTADTQGIDCSRFGGTASSSGISGQSEVGQDDANQNAPTADVFTPQYTPNLIGHDEDGWAMTMCTKCVGRPETMVRMCRRFTSLEQCQRHEWMTGQQM